MGIGTLPEVIRDINKYSNNVMARQLLLTMADQVLNMPANTERGAAVVKSWLASKGIDAPELRHRKRLRTVAHRTYFAPRTMARMLLAAFKSPHDAGIHLVAAAGRL